MVASVGKRRSQPLLLLAREIDKALMASASTLAVCKSKLSAQQVTAFQSEIAGLVSVQTGCVNWRNPRTPAVAYWADFNTDPWCLHAHWTGGSGPRFIGIMISVHPSHSNAGGTIKSVSVSSDVVHKATPAANALANVFGLALGYTDLRNFMR